MIPGDEFIVHGHPEISGIESELMARIELGIKFTGGCGTRFDPLLRHPAAFREQAEITDGDGGIHGRVAASQSSGVFALSSARGVTGSSSRQSFCRRIFLGQRRSSANAFSNNGSAAAE